MNGVSVTRAWWHSIVIGGAAPPSNNNFVWQGSGTDYLEYSAGNQLTWS